MSVSLISPGISIAEAFKHNATESMKSTTVNWPRKFDVLGVEVSSTTYNEVVDTCIAAAKSGESGLVSFFTVHGVMTAHGDADYRYRVNSFNCIAPDGQPIRWSLNHLHKAGLKDRVYGPELMGRLCARAAAQDVSIYLYGSTDAVLKALKSRLEAKYPGISIAGMESPPFRALTPEENQAVVDRINASGAGLLFIGLGCPRQDVFAHQNRNAIKPVQLCVGAAFDFHAGTKKVAPVWMQDHGLEWLYRLVQEPGRLWKRYLVLNTKFVYLMAKRLVVGC